MGVIGWKVVGINPWYRAIFLSMTRSVENFTGEIVRSAEALAERVIRKLARRDSGVLAAMTRRAGVSFSWRVIRRERGSPSWRVTRRAGISLSWRE